MTCRGMNKYVDELPEANGESIHFEEMVTGMDNPLRQNIMDNQIHNFLHSQKCSCQLTNGTGMIFLPSTTSTREPCHTESRRQ